MPGEHSGGMIDQLYSPPPKRTRPTGKKAGPGRLKSGEKRAPERRKPAAKKPQYGTFTDDPRRNNGGGTGTLSTSNSSGGVGFPSTPAAPSISDFLGEDETYQSQLAALTKALANYQSQMGERTGEYNTEFARRLSDLNLTEQRNTSDQADDYAGRGLYISGLYGRARGDLERDFDNREGDMNLAKNQFLSGLNRDFTNFQEENNLSRQRAQQDALNRRSLQYML